MFHDYSESGPSLFSGESKIRGSFRLHPSNSTVANVIRRQILVGTPSVGFRTEPYEKSEVLIQTNTTPLVNEMIAHRIGMIPICAHPETFDPTRYEFHINKENTGKSIIDITASDFVVIERDPSDPMDEGKQIPSSEFFVPDPITKETCLITRLRPQWNPTAPHEKLVLKARACISTGKENIRWSPVSQCSFENTMDDNPDRLAAMFEKWVKDCKKIPEGTELTQISNERRDELLREYNTMERQRCFRISEKGEPNDFIFYVESVGVLSVPDCVRLALDDTVRLLAKYQDIDGEIPANLSIRHANTQFPCVEFLFKGESYTLGTLLQHYLVDLHIEGSEEPKISYAGFDPAHPLRNEMLLKVGVSNGIEDPEIELQTARLVVAKTARYLKSMFQEMLNEWTAMFNEKPQPN